jgi:hypothetical protein
LVGELPEGDVVFAVDLEIAKKKSFFLRIATQSQGSDVLDELRFCLGVGVHGVFQVEDALWDEIGV